MSGLVNDGHVHPFFTVKTSMNDTTKGQMIQQRAILQCYIKLSEGIFELLNVFLLIIAHQCSVLVRICTRLQLIHHFKGNIPTQTWFFSLNTGVLRLQHGRHPMVLSAKDDQIAVPQQHRPAVHRQNPGRPEGKPQSVGVSVRFRDNLQKILEPWNKTMDKQWNLTSISVFGSIVANQVNPNNGRLM